jgi:hypothetical protein
MLSLLLMIAKVVDDWRYRPPGDIVLMGNPLRRLGGDIVLRDKLARHFGQWPLRREFAGLGRIAQQS